MAKPGPPTETEFSSSQDIFEPSSGFCIYIVNVNVCFFWEHFRNNGALKMISITENKRSKMNVDQSVYTYSISLLYHSGISNSVDVLLLSVLFP